jgi:hypothetical protein
MERPRLPARQFLAADDDGSRFKGSPWVVGAVVRHDKRGRGVIVDRNDSTISVSFDTMPNGPPACFLLAYVGRMMAVEGVSRG